MSNEIVEGQASVALPAWAQELDSSVFDIGVHHDHFALAFEDGSLGLFDLIRGKVKVRVSAHSGSALRAKISPSGRFVASSGEDGFLRIFAAEDLTLIFERQISATWADCLSWSPAKDFVVCSAGKEIIGWGPTSLGSIHYSKLESTIAAIDWLDETTFGAGVYGGLRLFSIDAKDPTQSFNWKGSLISVAFSPKKDFVVCGSQDSSIHLWDLKSGDDLQMNGFKAKSREISFHHTGKWMANASQSDITIWDYSGGSPAGTRPQILGPTLSPIVCLKYQRKGDLLFTCDAGGAVLIWSPKTSHLPVAFAGVLDAPISCADWSMDDQSIITGLKKGAVISYSVPNLKPLK